MHKYISKRYTQYSTKVKKMKSKEVRQRAPIASSFETSFRTTPYVIPDRFTEATNTFRKEDSIDLAPENTVETLSVIHS
jgi:hypothetical protein